MEDFKIIYEFVANICKEHLLFGLLFAGAIFGVIWFIKRERLRDAKIAALEAAVLGEGVFFQRDAHSGNIVMASAGVALLTGNKFSQSEIVGRSLAQVFDRTVVDTLLDLDGQLNFHGSVVETNIPINGVPCTVAQRRNSSNGYSFFQTHIHPQHRVFKEA